MTDKQCRKSMRKLLKRHLKHQEIRKRNELGLSLDTVPNADKIIKGRKKLEKLLYYLMDKGLLINWHYNGNYVVKFKSIIDFGEMKKEDKEDW